jgi:transposase
MLNADVNGAINIMRKVAGDAPVRDILGMGVPNTPVRIRLAYEAPEASVRKLAGADTAANSARIKDSPQRVPITM